MERRGISHQSQLLALSYQLSTGMPRTHGEPRDFSLVEDLKLAELRHSAALHGDDERNFCLGVARRRSAGG